MKICNNSFFKTLKTSSTFAIYNITNNLSFWLKIYSNHWSWSPRMLESKSSNHILNWYWTKLSECQEINSWQLLPTLLKISWLKWKKSVEMPILRLSFKLWARILWMSLNLINLISKNYNGAQRIQAVTGNQQKNVNYKYFRQCCLLGGEVGVWWADREGEGPGGHSTLSTL